MPQLLSVSPRLTQSLQDSLLHYEPSKTLISGMNVVSPEKISGVSLQLNDSGLGVLNGSGIDSSSWLQRSDKLSNVFPKVGLAADGFGRSPATGTGTLNWKAIASQLAGNLGWLAGADVSRQNFPKNPGSELFEVRFFYLDSSNELQQEVIFATYDAVSNLVTGGRVTYLPGPDDLHTAKPILSGSPEVYLEVLNGTRKDFDDLRRNPVIRPFLASRPRAQVTSAEAMVFAKALIKATSQRGPSLNPDIHVSEACDCAILSFDHGFKWIPEQQPLRAKEATPSKGRTRTR